MKILVLNTKVIAEKGADFFEKEVINIQILRKYYTNEMNDPELLETLRNIRDYYQWATPRYLTNIEPNASEE